MPAVPVYARSAAVALPSDLDPARFKATLVVDRVDGKALTAADREALAVALAALVVKEPSAPPAKPAAKGPKKTTSARPARARKASSKAPARKAARRPSRG